MTCPEIIEQLNLMGNPEVIKAKAQKFGVKTSNALGIYHKDLKELAKKIPKDDDIALQLFDTGIYEARLLCSKLFNPANLTTDLMEKWISCFDNWEICDSFCMTVFAKSNHAVAKIHEWSDRGPEFEKRASFATLAAYCMADKRARNSVFLEFLPLIERQSTDERIYVKKAVNWALRSIGKRNIDLNQSAIACAVRILKTESKTAKWVAKDALKELESDSVRISDYPREVDRN